MADASPARTSFIGGEWSKALQGRFDRDDYPTSLKFCLNGMPTEGGQWARRSGSRWCFETRGGQPGRVANFDFKETAGYKIEFTDGFMRFRAGPRLVQTNDEQTIAGISAANPANVQTNSAHGWSTNDQVMFPTLVEVSRPLLNRVFKITKVSDFEFTLQDAISGDAIDGTDIESLDSGTVRRVKEIATPYVGDSWGSVRIVQTDIMTQSGSAIGGVMLHGSYKPYVLQVVTEPTTTADATFTFAAATLKDGPYLDPVPGGTLATPSAKIGIIGITLSFPAYDAAKAYAKDDYVTASSVNYKSLQDANLNNTPASSAAYWVAVNASDAIGPKGFQGTDIGRMIRLFSEPAEWSSGTSYVLGDKVRTGNPSTYWYAIASSTGVTPGTDASKWNVLTAGTLWTWGKITSLSSTISRSLAGSVNIGNMVNGGGVAAAFDGVFSRTATSASQLATSGIASPNTTYSFSAFVGKDFSGASDQKIQQATIYPSTDLGLVTAVFTPRPGLVCTTTVSFYLRGSATAPASASDGTVIGSLAGFNTSSPVVLTSTDTSTAWKYVWVELVIGFTFTGTGTLTSYSITAIVGQLSLFNPPGTGVSDGANVQILGDALLYTLPIRTWRLGVFSDTTGWPTCGSYHEGRLWLSGVVGNRIDGSKSNDPFNFAPTGPDGTVAGNNGISYVFNSKDINPIFWMETDDLGLICGTQAGEWLVQATTQNVPLSPTTIQAHRVTRYGCANVEPSRTDLTVAIVQTFKREILEYFGEVTRGKFSAQSLSYFSRHLTKTGIAQIAYQQELVPTIWQRMTDGSLVGMTYFRESLVSAKEPDARGAYRIALGTSRAVESITVGPSQDGLYDELAMVTNDSTTPVRYVEIMQKMFMEGDDIADAFFLDAAIVPPVYKVTSTNVVVYGLWPHNGKSVSAFAGGLYLGEFTVANGSITLTYGDGVAGTTASLFTAAFVDTFEADAMPIVVGFKYTSNGQLTPAMLPAESGARTGPALGKLRRANRYAAMVVNAVKGTLSFGGDLLGTLYPAVFKYDDESEYSPLTLFNGIHKDSLEDGYDFDNALAWQISDPYPATIAAVETFMQTTDA